MTDASERVLRGFSLAIKFSLALAIGGAVYEQQWATLFVSAVTLLLVFLLPRFLERSYHIALPIEFEFAIALFIYASLFLGEVSGYYTRFWWWDLVLHAGAGLGFALVGFLLVYGLYSGGRVQAKPGLIALLAFSFSTALGALWEIFEFSGDHLFGTNMQKSGLVDTMWDLIVNVAGALLVSLAGLQYIRRGKAGMVERFIRAFVVKNPLRFR